MNARTPSGNAITENTEAQGTQRVACNRFCLCVLCASVCSVLLLLAMSAGMAMAGDDATQGGATQPATTAPAATQPAPFLLKPAPAQFDILKNWTFGNQRPDATIHNKAELDAEFYYRYIWEDGKLDKL